jgi:group I intron endonuclease
VRHIVYKTTNLTNGRFYVGMHSTENIDDGYLGSGTAFWNALEKYGKECFKKEILEECDDRSSLIECERKWILQLNAVDGDLGYNIRRGGTNSFYGGTRPEEVRQKISNTLKGRKLPRHVVEKVLNNRSKPKWSEEQKKRMRDLRTGVVASESTKQKISSANKGRVKTENEILKIKEAAKNMPIVTCPHCGKSGRKNAMARWHFDNCKYGSR